MRNAGPPMVALIEVAELTVYVSLEKLRTCRSESAFRMGGLSGTTNIYEKRKP